MVADDSGRDDCALVYGSNGRVAVGKIQKTLAAFAALFLAAACQTATESPDLQDKVAISFPPPQAIRTMKYPCWRGVHLIDAMLEDDMEPSARGVLLHQIDPNTPLIEFWENDKKFAIIAVYPQHKLVCAVLVGDAIDGTW
tara:strand:- start:4005 stop:4427 length:423 start_codon:yes stop_codon:yes gene_type:complete